MTKGKILLGPSSFGAASPAPVELLQAAGYEIVDNPFKRRLTREELLGLLPGIKGLIAGLEPLDRGVLEQSELKALSRVGSGMSNVDMPAAQALGIHVSSTPDGPTLAVAELTVGCLMNLLRQTSAMDRAMRTGEWDKRMGRQLRDLTIAIVGYGRIGRKTGELFSALGAKIQIVDPFVDAASVSAPVVSLEQALEGADAIALHASGETCIIDAAGFGRMKPGMFLLNAARGELIDYDALFAALADGRVAGIWADAHPQEPYKGKLLEFDQALLTPHIGSYSLEGRIQMELDAAQNLLNDLEKAS